MSISHSSGNTSITGSVSVTTSEAGLVAATYIPYTQLDGGNGSVKTHYTVPAGKVFYLFNMAVMESGTSSLLYDTTGASQIGYISNAGNNAFAATANAKPILKLAAGEFLKTNTTNGKSIWFTGLLGTL